MTCTLYHMQATQPGPLSKQGETSPTSLEGGKAGLECSCALDGPTSPLPVHTRASSEMVLPMPKIPDPPPSLLPSSAPHTLWQNPECLSAPGSKMLACLVQVASVTESGSPSPWESPEALDQGQVGRCIG